MLKKIVFLVFVPLSKRLCTKRCLFGKGLSQHIWRGPRFTVPLSTTSKYLTIPLPASPPSALSISTIKLVSLSKPHNIDCLIRWITTFQMPHGFDKSLCVLLIMNASLLSNGPIPARSAFCLVRPESRNGRRCAHRLRLYRGRCRGSRY